MIKVLVAEENVAEANKYCRYLSKCRDLKIKTVNSGDQALSTYLKTKPNIFILDSHFNDINSTEIIDRLSITYNEGNNSNILLTANSAEENKIKSFQYPCQHYTNLILLQLPTHFSH